MRVQSSSVLLNSPRFPESWYIKSGQGPFLFLLHGFAEDHRIWDKILPVLEKNFTCICPDFPGSGRSLLPEEPITMNVLAAFVYEIARQENAVQILLAGHSMGGYVALAFAAAYQQQVAGLSLLHSTTLPDDEERIKNRRKAIRLITDGGREGFIKTLVPNLYGDSTKEAQPDLLIKHLEMAMPIEAAALIHYYEAMIQRADHQNLLQQGGLPIQFIIGMEDQLLPYTSLIRQCLLPEICELTIVPRCGHSSMMEYPAHCAERLKGFANYVYKR